MENLKVVKVWGTLDSNREFAYVDIYDNEEDAKSDIGKIINGLEIDGVVQGWCVVGDADEDLEDFHFTYYDAIDEKNTILHG